MGSSNIGLINLIQEKLGVKVDGDFGNITKSAVESFQAKNGLSITGVVDQATADKLGVKLDSVQLTIEQVKVLSNVKDFNTLVDITKNLNLVMAKYKINTKLRVSHFIGQLLHESGGLLITKENLNYSADGLLKTFPKYFKTADKAAQYAKKGDSIANYVYANRMGNGDEKSGDGSKCKGRGYIQITGKDNYTKLSKDLGVDFLAEPTLLESPKYASLSAGWFWNTANLNALADKDDVIGITKKINGGTNGLDDRKLKVDKVKKILG